MSLDSFSQEAPGPDESPASRTSSGFHASREYIDILAKRDTGIFSEKALCFSPDCLSVTELDRFMGRVHTAKGHVSSCGQCKDIYDVFYQSYDSYKTMFRMQEDQSRMDSLRCRTCMSVRELLSQK